MISAFDFVTYIVYTPRVYKRHDSNHFIFPWTTDHTSVSTMQTMWITALVTLTLLCQWSTVHAQSRNCTYADLCERRYEILGRELVYDIPCLQQEVCTEFYGEWSRCTATCGGGTRIRFGRCCSAKCTRIISENEDCNTSAC